MNTTETAPSAIRLRCRQLRGFPLQFRVEEAEEGELLDLMDRQRTAAFLREHGYRWLAGSQGVWVRA